MSGNVFEDSGQTLQQVEEDEEDDYMSMQFIEPPKKYTGKETLTQRTLRKQRESEEKSRAPSKAERAAAEAARLDASLATPALDRSNKGFQMMARLGYKPGSALGKDTSADESSPGNGLNSRLMEPISVTIKENRGGIGLETEKKRKFREEAEIEAKRTKIEEGEFRQRISAEKDEKRREAQFAAAQKVVEKLDNEVEEVEDPQLQYSISESINADFPPLKDGDRKAGRNAFQLSNINILYRGLVRDRERKASEHQAARDRLRSLSPNRANNSYNPPDLNDHELESDDKIALGTLEEEPLEIEFDEHADKELEEFNALSSQERLRQAVLYLREKYHYCFWCKFRYESAEMNDCPGLTEEDHD